MIYLKKGVRMDYKNQKQSRIQELLFISSRPDTFGALRHSTSSKPRRTCVIFSRFENIKVKAHKTFQKTNDNSDSSALICHFLLLFLCNYFWHFSFVLFVLFFFLLTLFTITLLAQK